MSDRRFQKKLTEFLKVSDSSTQEVESWGGLKPDTSPQMDKPDELLDEFLEDAERRYSKGGYQTVRMVLKKFSSFLGEKRVAEARLKDVREFLWEQAERKVRSSTIKYYLSAVRELYRYLASYHSEADVPNLEGLSSKDFSSNLPEPIERKPLTEEEVKKLINQPSNVRDRLLLAIFRYTGLRVGEMSGLRVKDVDWKSQPPRVKVRAESAKLGKPRKVPFPRRLVPLIRTWLERDRPSYLNSCNSPYLFVSKSGEKLSIQRIEKMVGEYAEKAGIQEVLGVTSDGKKFHKVTPHALRHTFATHLLNKSMRPEHVMVLMGHEQLKTTMRYAKVEEEKAFESYEEIF